MVKSTTLISVISLSIISISLLATGVQGSNVKALHNSEHHTTETTDVATEIAGKDGLISNIEILTAIKKWRDGDTVSGQKISNLEILSLIKIWRKNEKVADTQKEISNETTVTVASVVDGDTFDIRYENGSKDTVRMIGVDTPEIYVENDLSEFENVSNKSCLEFWGKEASSFVESQINDERVNLTFDSNEDNRGYYGRLLAYVYIDGVLLNHKLVERGYARVYDSQFTKRNMFYDTENEAQTNERGLWKC